MIRAAPARDLESRTAIVTGASSGIGRAAAVMLADRGARVIATARNEKALVELAAASAGIFPFAADLADTSSAFRIAKAASRHGPPTILICAAGLPGYIDQPLAKQSYAAWRATMAVNLDAPFLLSQAVMPFVQAEKWGRFVYVSSTAGLQGAPSMSAYCASKHGVIGLMRAVAHDVGAFHATANAVCPGWVRTPMAEADAQRESALTGVSEEEIWRQRDMSYPRGHVLSAEEVASVISYLSSDAAAGVNGEAVTVALGGRW